VRSGTSRPSARLTGVKRAWLLLFPLVLAACGSAVEGTDVPASSGFKSGPVDTSVESSVDESDLKPPRIVLRAVEDQKAVPGSSCVEYVDPASGSGTGVCGDTGAVHPKAVSVVMPGDEVTFVFDGAEIVRSGGCHADDEQDCIGSVSVRPLGCEGEEIERVPLELGPETPWTVELEPGAYELDVFGYFESEIGATGDVSGALGLLVGGGPKEDDALGVVAVEPSMQVCAFPR
jgi:hypothetical protein